MPTKTIHACGTLNNCLPNEKNGLICAEIKKINFFQLETDQCHTDSTFKQYKSKSTPADYEAAMHKHV